jgi:hypothetical protein
MYTTKITAVDVQYHVGGVISDYGVRVGVLNSRSPNRARAHTHRHVRAL